MNQPKPNAHHLTCRCISACLALCLGGCTVGPNYREPRTVVPEKFTTTQPAGDLSHWWDQFNDPQLDELVDKAVRNNLDLQLAEARVREARAQRQYLEAGLFPEVDTVGAYDRVQISKNAGIAGFLGASTPGAGNSRTGSTGSGNTGGGSSGGTLGTGNGTGAAAPALRRRAVGSGGGSSSGSSSGGGFAIPSRLSLWQGALDASWEIDVFARSGDPLKRRPMTSRPSRNRDATRSSRCWARWRPITFRCGACSVKSVSLKTTFDHSRRL